MPSQPVFESWPDIYDLVPKGGIPGFTYLITPSERVNDMESEYAAEEVDKAQGWVTHFTVRGEKGEVPCRLMQMGSRVDGIDPGMIRCPLWHDTVIAERTGLRIIEPIENPAAIQQANAIRDKPADPSKPGPKPRNLPKMPEQETVADA